MKRSLTLMLQLLLVIQCTSQDQVVYHDPVWSPDGKKIAFYSNRDGDFDVYIINSDGTGLKQITDHPATDGTPCWSPDGKKIVFNSNRGNKSELYIYNLEDKSTSKLTNHEGNKGASAWSPDGKSIVFQSNMNGPKDLYIINPDGSNLRNLTHNEANDFRPSWSLDGRYIYFNSNRTGKYQIYRMNADGSDVTRLFPTDYHQTSATVMHTQNKLIFTSHFESGVRISILDLDSKELEHITDASTDKMMASFSVDDKEIVFVEMEINEKTEINTSNLYIMDYLTRKVRPLIK